MNTLKNKIAVVTAGQKHNFINLIDEAKSQGCTMIEFEGKIYGLELLSTSRESKEYLLQYTALFTTEELNNLQAPGGNIKFNKSLEALYNISMSMADTCIVNKTIEQRFEKLEEEYRELIEAFANHLVSIREHEEDERLTTMLHATKNHLVGELADVLFVLLHIAHKLEVPAFQLLHASASKMLKRMNDVNYIAKN